MISNLLKILLIALIFIGAAGLSAYLTLTLIIKSKETVVVPILKGKEVVYTLQMLSDLGLNTQIKKTQYHVAVPLNHVIDQEPSPGSEIKKGRTIRLIISRGQLSVPIPSLSGLPLSQALVKLEEKGFCVGIRSYSQHTVLPSGLIIAQSPTAGVISQRNKCVDLLISAGPYHDAFAMIDLNTLPLDEAILKIEANGLKLGSITSVINQDVPLDTVTRQTPLAGYRIEAGQMVQLSVNQSRSNNGPGMATTQKQTWLLHYRNGPGLLNTHVTFRINSVLFSYDLFNDFISPNKDLLFLIPYFKNITVMLYEDEKLKRIVFPSRSSVESNLFRLTNRNY